MLECFNFENLNNLDSEQPIITKIRDLQYARKKLSDSINQCTNNELLKEYSNHIILNLIKAFILHTIKSNSKNIDSEFHYYYKYQRLSDSNLICMYSWKYSLLQFCDLKNNTIKTVHLPDDKFCIHPYTNNKYYFTCKEVYVYNDEGKYMFHIPINKKYQCMDFIVKLENDNYKIFEKYQRMFPPHHKTLPPSDHLFLYIVIVIHPKKEQNGGLEIIMKVNYTMIMENLLNC